MQLKLTHVHAAALNPRLAHCGRTFPGFLDSAPHCKIFFAASPEIFQ